MIRISLNQGRVAIISPEDEALVLDGRRWSFTKPARSCGYAMRQIRRKCAVTGLIRYGTMYMHRLIAGAGPGELVDHINGDGLDNRRDNLRIATKSLNCVNRRGYAPASGYRGVYASGSNWKAVLTCNGEDHRGGTFSSKIEAAKKYDELAKHFFGEFAVLNFPEDR